MATLFEASLTDDQARSFKVLFVRLFAALDAAQTIVAGVEPAVPASRSAPARTAGIWDAYELVGLFLQQRRLTR